MFRPNDILKLRINQTNPKPSSNRYRFLRYSKYGDYAVVVGTKSKGTLQYFDSSCLELEVTK